MIDFRTSPQHYQHWHLSIDGPVATLAMDVREDGGLMEGYELKLNSYDLGVDIELYDAVQRLRFEHPEVRSVVLTSGKERIFCAGANIRMLGKASHAHKVAFCKFTNETRLSIEDATEHSRQTYLTAINGPCAGGGYELALATDYIILVDDGSSSVSLPEVPLLAVLPGTGGLTRLVDKRHVRRDRADFFCTVEEGVRGNRARDWGLVDEVVPSSRLQERVAEKALELAAASDRPNDDGVSLTPLERQLSDSELRYSTVEVRFDRAARTARLILDGPDGGPPASVADLTSLGCAAWPLRFCRELDDALLHLRFNEPELGTWVLESRGNGGHVAAWDEWLLAHREHWLAREILLYLRRTLKRLDYSSRSMIALIEPGSCFTGTLLEIALAADRSYMLDGQFEGDDTPPATVQLTAMNLGPLAQGNGMSRLATRFLNDPQALERAAAAVAEPLDAAAAESLGLVTFAPDDIDWEDEVRIAVEERASFSGDALSGMEANLRFPGPETLETKIFARLSAWQNWIFQRPNAVGEHGALTLYGTGERQQFDNQRV